MEERGEKEVWCGMMFVVKMFYTSVQLLLTLLSFVCTRVLLGLCVPSCLTQYWKASVWLTHQGFCQGRNRELVEVRRSHIHPPLFMLMCMCVCVFVGVRSLDPFSCSSLHSAELWTAVSAFPFGCVRVFFLAFSYQGDSASFISKNRKRWQKRWALNVLSHTHTQLLT